MMRSRLCRLTVLAMMVAACGEPSAAGIEIDPQLSVTAESPYDRVVLNSVFSLPDGATVESRREFDVQRLTDGLSVLTISPNPEATATLRGLDRNNTDGFPPVRGMMRLSQGIQLFGADGAPVRRSERLQSSGISIDDPLPGIREEEGKPATYRDVPRRGRTVRPEYAQEDLEDLRSGADEEERVAPDELRFVRTLDGMVETWLFDEVVGAVVEHTITSPGRPDVRIRHDYRSSGDVFILIGTVTEWIGGNGVIRRVERSYERR